MVMSLAGTGTKIDCAGVGQSQFTLPDRTAIISATCTDLVVQSLEAAAEIFLWVLSVSEIYSRIVG
jgi:hypothetical protein